MSRPSSPRRRWNVAQVVLAILIVAMVVATQFYSHAPRMLTNRPWVVKVADIPARVDIGRSFASISTRKTSPFRRSDTARRSG